MLFDMYCQFLCPAYWKSILAMGNLHHFPPYETLEASNNKMDNEEWVSSIKVKVDLGMFYYHLVSLVCLTFCGIMTKYNEKDLD